MVLKKQKVKKPNFFVYFIAIALIAIFVLLSVISSFKAPSLPKSLYSLPLAGYDEVAVSVSLPNIVVLTCGCYEVQATTSTEQTESILRAIQGIEVERPNSHDLTKFILDEYGINVLAVKIDEIRDKSYVSKLVLQKGNKVLNLESKPSDAIAIALRMKKPVYMKKELIEAYGRSIC